MQNHYLHVKHLLRDDLHTFLNAGYAKNYDGQIGSSKQYFISKLNFDAIPGMIVAGGV